MSYDERPLGIFEPAFEGEPEPDWAYLEELFATGYPPQYNRWRRLIRRLRRLRRVRRLLDHIQQFMRNYDPELLTRLWLAYPTEQEEQQRRQRQ